MKSDCFEPLIDSFPSNLQPTSVRHDFLTELDVQTKT